MAELIDFEQPALFTIQAATRLTFEALVDPEDQTVVISFIEVEYPSQTLRRTLTAPSVPFADVDRLSREIGRAFTEALRRHTGPF